MSLRPYQAECVDTIIEEHAAGVAGQLISIPTSAGKTHIAAQLPYKVLPPKGKALFIVGAEELVWQAQEKIQYNNPDLTVGVEKADRKADLTRHDIIIASVQSLARKKRLARFRPDSFQLAGVDEAHHTTPSGAYHDILAYFESLKSEPNFNPNNLLYGLTATANRSDKVGLEHTFSKITYHKSLLDLMRTGVEINGKLYPYIANIVCHRVDTYADISKVRTRMGDLSDNELAEIIDTPDRNKIVLDSYVKLGRGLGAFGYTVNIAHAVHLAEAFNDGGVPAAVMHGGTPREGSGGRKHLFAALAEGSLKVIFSCGVLGEGVDQPRVTVGMMVRPTKSPLLFQQQAGRILRPFPAPEELKRRYLAGEPMGWRKKHAILIDFVDQSGHHSLIHTPSLFGLRNDFDMAGQSALEVVDEVERLEAATTIDVRGQKSIYEIKSLIEQVDLLKPPITPPKIRKISRYTWLETGPEKYCLALPGNRSIRLSGFPDGTFEISTYTNGLKAVRAAMPTLRMAVEYGDGLVPPEDREALREGAAWQSEPPTEQQCAYLYSLDKKHLGPFHRNCRDFWSFATEEYDSGNNNYSKGAIAKMISARQLARPTFVQQKIAERRLATR